MSVASSELNHWREWVGRTVTQSEILDPECLRRFAAAIAEDVDIDAAQPSLAHWAFFLPVAPAEQLGEDGHPQRGSFLPPVTLPRRMFASADMQFGSALTLGQPADRTSTVVDVVAKSGRSGDLVLVQVDHAIVQNGETKVRERQTIIYRAVDGSIPPIQPTEVPAESGDVHWQPRAVDLFRFSAATFNSHRIHYDLPYATREEGYPTLVVHGPFTATKLFGRARERGRPSAFSFRAVAPIFVGQPVILRVSNEVEMRAIRVDGLDAIVATADY